MATTQSPVRWQRTIPMSNPANSRNALTWANLQFHAFRTLVLPLLAPVSAHEVSAPVVIGGHGGSGTRVLPRALRLVGVWMGAWVNHRTEDAMATRYFLQRYFEQAVVDSRAADPGQRPDPAPDQGADQEPDPHRDQHWDQHAAQRRQLERAFAEAVRAHRQGMPDPSGPWGWKNPRSMWMLPFLARLYPQMRFIHLVRDGRDVALSKNTNLLNKHGRFLLGEATPEQDRVRSQLRLWALGNERAARDGERLLGANYLRISYEQLCSAPRETLARVYAHLGQSVSSATLDQAAQLVVPPRTIGAWRKSDLRLLHEPDREIRAVLHRFGYSDEPPDPEVGLALDSAAPLGQPAT
jgi:hypothetical protein